MQMRAHAPLNAASNLSTSMQFLFLPVSIYV